MAPDETIWTSSSSTPNMIGVSDVIILHQQDSPTNQEAFLGDRL
jgi:hypothetical protein